MSYNNYVLAIVTNENIAVGNSLAGAIGYEPGDSESFTNGTKLYPQGTTFGRDAGNFIVPSQPDVARFVGVALKETGLAMVNEFAGDGPYPLLNSASLTDQQIAYAKARVVFTAGDRAVVETHWQQFITDNGYVVP